MEYQFCRGKSVSEMLSGHGQRFAVVTNLPWMESYCSLDEGESQHRTAHILRHAEGFALWMGILSQFHQAFSHPYSFDADSREIYASWLFRLDLLCLAGGNIKPSFDAALAGYYSSCMALERHMFETWRRVVYVRLHPSDVWRWIPQSAWPDDVVPASDDLPPEKGGMPTSIPRTERIANAITELGSDDDRQMLSLARSGFDHLSDHAHPSFEGTTQIWSPDDLLRRNFGPTYREHLAIDCLEWGLIAGIMLLIEVGNLGNQGTQWNRQLNLLKIEVGKWRNGDKVERREFPSTPPMT